MRFFGMIMLLLTVGACKKDVPTHSFQYEIRKFYGNQSIVKAQFLDPSSATVSTGEIDTVLWQSPVYKNVKEGTSYKLELEVELGNPKFDMIIKKDNSVIARKEVRKSMKEYIIFGEL